MNKFTIILPLLFLGSLTANAQEFHLSAGYNGSNVSSSGDEQWVGRAGYQFGADVLLGQRWFVKPGVHFLVRNLNYTHSSGSDVTAQEYSYTSRSLSIPLMVGINLMDPADDPEFNIYAMGGPTALMNLSADLNNDQLSVTTSGSQWYLGFGAGLKFSFLFVEAGYDAAMSNVFRGNAFDTNPKVNYIHAIAGIRLQLAK